MLRRSARRREGTAEPTNSAMTELERENAHLKRMLADRASARAYRTGYLYKYRPYATAALFTDPWALRFFAVQDGALTYYKTEQDVHYPPRGLISLPGTYVEDEGVKRGKYYAFKIVDRNGDDLLRLSTESRSNHQAWMDALERAGCIKRGEILTAAVSTGTTTNQLSPATSVMSETTDTATSGRGGGGAVAGGGGGNYREHSSRGHVSFRHDAAMERAATDGWTSDVSETRAPIRIRREVALPPPPPSSSPRAPPEKASYDPAENVHKIKKESILTDLDKYKRSKSNKVNNTGVFTVGVLIIAVTNFRLILENLIKYGFRFNPLTFIQTAFSPAGNMWLFVCWPVLAANIIAALLIERFAKVCLAAESRAEEAARKRDVPEGQRLRRSATRARLTEYLVVFLNIINTSFALVFPCAVIHITYADPLPSFAVTTAAAVVWLKLVSYAHVNFALRRIARNVPLEARFEILQHHLAANTTEFTGAYDAPALRWPRNLSFRNIWYFMAIPTLCYQLDYPKNKRFRLRWTLRRVIMLSLSLGMMLFIIEQYIEPTIDNSLKLLQEMDWLRMVERVLKLSIPTLYFWLAMFYALFHLWLNILAELTGFGDREFYREWWNATTVGEYWRLWNMPVHKWMLRHVYFPALRAGVPKFAAGVISFFVSAVFHELLVGVPLHMLRGWAFWGIMAQVPLIWITEVLKRKFNNDRVGNVIFWVSFCFLGQPLAEILYFHDWRKLSS